MRNNTHIAFRTLTAGIALAMTACGGGGGGGLVRNSPPPAPQSPPPAPPPSPPPPPPVNIGPCPAPTSTGCSVTTSGLMLGGRSSAGQLTINIQANGEDLNIGNADPSFDNALGRSTYTFSGGTIIEFGSVVLQNFNTLTSDVTIREAFLSGFPASQFKVRGTVNGTINNAGSLVSSGSINGNLVNTGYASMYAGAITGNLENSGRLLIYSSIYETGINPRVSGNFSQSGPGTLIVELAAPTRPQSDSSGVLMIGGRADLAGTLELRNYSDDWGPYPPPATGEYKLLHADGGVFGTFDRWTSPGYFVQGSIRYGSNDAWFDLTRISVLTAASTNGLGNALTLASAGNLDRVLSIADGFAGQPSAPQQAFLASASKLLWMHDPAQATRAIDSLSGAIHADALESTADGAATRSLLGAHLDGVAPGHAIGAWLLDDGHGAIAGVDQWLGPHLLAGVHASQRNATDTASASANDLGSGGYLRWFGDDGWYAGLDAGVSHRTLAVGRTIDFGDAGRWLARSRRSLDAASASVEAGKRLPVLGGSLTPFVGVGVSSVQAAAASEQGTSGFELQLADTQLRGSRASAGLRFARDWRWGDACWFRLNAATGIDHSRWNGHQQATFLGVPNAWFDLPASSAGRQRWASLGLQGGWGHGWTWNAARSTGRAFGSDHAWQLSLRREW
jgi:hypothetical protein